MPLYGYQCRDCGQVFEIRATFKQKEQGLHPVCPSCESAGTQQVVSAPMIIRPAPAMAPTCPCQRVVRTRDQDAVPHDDLDPGSRGDRE